MSILPTHCENQAGIECEHIAGCELYVSVNQLHRQVRQLYLQRLTFRYV